MKIDLQKKSKTKKVSRLKLLPYMVNLMCYLYDFVARKSLIVFCKENLQKNIRKVTKYKI